MKKLLFAALAALAFVIPATANAQWADPPGTGLSANAKVFNYVAPAAPASVAASTVESTPTVTDEQAAPEYTVVPAPVVNVEIPAKVEGSAVVSTPVVNDPTPDRPPVPCNPIALECGPPLPPGTVVTGPDRPAVPCNPFRYEDPCNGYIIPPGVTVSPPPRPGIPCTIYTLRHCTDEQIAALQAAQAEDIAAGRYPRSSL